MSTDLYRETVATIQSLAREAFAEHVARAEGLNEWRCGRPGTGMYAFTVLVRPSVVVVWGDLGECVLRHTAPDSIGWLRGATQREYLVDKVKAGDSFVFYAAEALAWLDKNVDDERQLGEPQAAEACAFRGKVRDVLETIGDPDLGDFDATFWHYAFREAGGDDAPDCMYPSSGALWLFEAIRWFAAALERQEAAA